MNKANQIPIPYKIVERRLGDIAKFYAEVSKAKRELGWSAKNNLVDRCRDSWCFEEGYKEQWLL